MGTDRTDEELYESFIVREDEEAMRILFEKYCDPLTFFIGRIVNDPDDAEDIMMDCFASVIAGSARFKARGGCSFKTWLYAVAKKSAYYFLRKRHVTESLDDDDNRIADELAAPGNGLLKDEETQELYKALYRALDSLSADQRTVLYLKYFEDMDTEQISKVTGKSIRQIYKLTDKGKSRLRELLKNTDLL
ncbi:MAG: sigma-70 family RNA polymerase sigma factor [Lachnospiraceae bacterium]|nr:sigma-70 family RNA polymerase sigma factor [Lachnospiraceae bacterium]